MGCGGKTVEIESASETTEKKEVSATVAGTGAENTGKIDLSKFEDEDIGVCLVINTNLGDKSICDLSYAGLEEIAIDYGVRTKCIELAGDATKQVPTFIDLAEDPEWDIIIAGTPNLRESLLEVAEDYPEQPVYPLRCSSRKCR